MHGKSVGLGVQGSSLTCFVCKERRSLYPEKGRAPDKLIFRHGVELTVSGTYPDLYAYLAGLEKLPTQLYWGRADLSVSTHPVTTLKLTVYTLSLDPAWMLV